MTDLIHLAETAAPEQQREVLEAAYDVCPWAHRGGNNYARFTAMLDCCAYVDAALMLLKPSWLWRVMPSDYGPDWLAEVWLNDEYAARASTPALALLAAIARAKEPDG